MTILLLLSSRGTIKISKSSSKATVKYKLPLKSSIRTGQSQRNIPKLGRDVHLARWIRALTTDKDKRREDIAAANAVVMEFLASKDVSVIQPLVNRAALQVPGPALKAKPIEFKDPWTVDLFFADGQIELQRDSTASEPGFQFRSSRETNRASIQEEEQGEF